ncbi:MAG: hypothetical protein U5M50_10515 [Sphingobium sp.]|nr:hypothetical protein [Sphingobium sp.]
MSASRNAECAARVAFDLGQCFMAASQQQMTVLVADPTVSPEALRHGMLKAHVDGAAAAIAGGFPQHQHAALVHGLHVYLSNLLNLPEVTQ